MGCSSIGNKLLGNSQIGFGEAGGLDNPEAILASLLSAQIGAGAPAGRTLIRPSGRARHPLRIPRFPAPHVP